MVHIEHLNKRKIKIISLVSFLLGFSEAILVYILSSYFKAAINSENFGVFYLISYSVALVFLLNYHKFVNKLGKSNVFFESLLLKNLFLLLLIFSPPSIASVICLMFFMIFGHITWLGIDIMLESFSTDKMSGRIRGMHLTVLNAGVLVGPLLSVVLYQKFNFHGIFIVSFIIDFVVIIVSLAFLRNINHNNSVRKEKILNLIGKVWKNKNLLNIYYISFVLEFFYALMVAYSPIYLRDLGMSWNQIGIIFTIMLTPFVFLQYPIGLVADKRMGEKELIIFAIFVLAFSTVAFYFVQSTSVALWAGILLLTRIGAAMIEVLRDSYFYKQICEKDFDIVSLFRTTRSVAYILASGIAVLTLLFFPVRSIFIIVALISFSAIVPAFRLEDTKCEKELLELSKN